MVGRERRAENLPSTPSSDTAEKDTVMINRQVTKNSAQPTPGTDHPLLRYPRMMELSNYTVVGMTGVAALVLALSYPMLSFYAFVTVAMLTPAVLLHEWGHYIVARRAGLHVKEFSIGFGRRVYSRRSTKTGVLWSLKLLPLGGSVEVAGMTAAQVEKEGTPRDQAFIYAPIRTRVRLTLWGPLVNLVLAWVSLSVASAALAPDRAGIYAYLLAPVSGIVLLVSFVGMSLSGLVSLVFDWAGAEVGSIFSMPSAMEAGVAEASTSGMPTWVYIVVVFSLLNLSLGVFNALPLFPLDGYHAFVAGVDGVRRRKARRRGASFFPLTSAQLSAYNKASGFTVAIFVVLVVGKDVAKLFST